jgi:hypothetical protein
MSDYKIKSIGKVDFRTYKDVVRVIATKERGFWASLFSSPREAYFILSEESPLYGAVNAAKSNESIWDVSESSFTVERVNGTFYSVEKSIALYENKKAKRIAETKRQADEAKKAKEQQTQRKKEETDRKRKEEETAKQIDEAFKKATAQKVSLSDFQVCVDENASFSDQMAGIAGNVNLCFVTGNKQGVTDNLVKLYTKVQGYNSHLLKNIEAKDGQMVGLAFIKMALYFTNGNFLVNEIAAQNAYYCIAKNFLIAKNIYALPALFTLFVKRPQTLVDELYNVNPDPTLLGLGGMIPSAPYRKKDRAMENRLPIMTYILSKFYDENKKIFLIDTSLPYHIPNQEDINTFHKELRVAKLGSKKEILVKGEEYFSELYEIIDEHLNL